MSSKMEMPSFYPSLDSEGQIEMPARDQRRGQIVAIIKGTANTQLRFYIGSKASTTLSTTDETVDGPKLKIGHEAASVRGTSDVIVAAA